MNWRKPARSKRFLILLSLLFLSVLFLSSRRRHTRSLRDWSSDVCSSDLSGGPCGCLRCGSGHRPASPPPPPTTAGRPAARSGTTVPSGAHQGLRGGSSCPARYVPQGRSAGPSVDRKRSENCENHAKPSSQFAPFKGTIFRRKFGPKFLLNSLLNAHRHDHAAIPFVLHASNDAWAQSVLEFEAWRTKGIAA